MKWLVIEWEQQSDFINDAVGVSLKSVIANLQQLPFTSLWNWSSGSAWIILELLRLNKESTKICVFLLLQGIKASHPTQILFLQMPKSLKFLPHLILGLYETNLPGQQVPKRKKAMDTASEQSSQAHALYSNTSLAYKIAGFSFDFM